MNPEEVDKLKCSQCEYQTLDKSSLKRHFVRHMNPEEVDTFKCSQCEYKTHNKSYLKEHSLRHMNLEEVDKLKRSQCEYQTLDKSSLKRHLPRHMNPDDTEYLSTLAIKAESEVEDFKIENVPLKPIKFNIGEEPESNLFLQLEDQETFENVVLDHCYGSTAFSEFSQSDYIYKNIPNDETVQLVRVKNVEAIDTPDYIRISNSTIENKELGLKEENLEVAVMGFSEPPPLIWLKNPKERCPTDYNYCKEENVGEMDEEVESSILRAVLSNDIPTQTYLESLQCGDQTMLESNLHNKLSGSVKSANDQVLKCHRCNFKTFHGESLTDHHFRHNINSQEHLDLFKCCCQYKFKCNDCKYQTCYKGNLKRHLLQHEIPEDVKKYKCNDCDYLTIRKSDLKIHKRRHTGLEQYKKFKCNNCNYRTFHKGHFKIHMLRHMNPEECKTFKCHNCNYRTLRKNSLMAHMQQHMNPKDRKKFICNNCSFWTFHKRSLKAHMLRHMNPV